MKEALTSSSVNDQLHTLVKRIRDHFLEAKVSVDIPDDVHGVWFIDINHKGHSVIVQWKHDRGFGITSKADIAYGEGADELYPDADSAYHRLFVLLLDRSGTSPPLAERFRELREALGISQAALAQIVGIQQASISKFEHRSDILLSTLNMLVEGIGGKLKILVSVNGHEIELGGEGNIPSHQLRQSNLEVR